jgi:4-amino-4-deoxy-L-arabinose transferase-like glycosyltransferase
MPFLTLLKSRLRVTVPGATITPDRAVTILIVTALVFRLVWGAVLEASNDESYHYLYTTHPALSYFDHPPMLMWVARAGILLCGGWVHPLSLRLGFVLLFAVTTWIVYRWVGRWYNPWAGFYAALFLNLSAYYLAAGGLALPDGPFLLFAVLTSWALCEAILAKPGQILPWVWVGLGFGGALLSKYHAVLLPAGVVVYALLTPGARWLLRSPGPYLAIAIGSAAFAPVLIWNAENEWASFAFQAGRATGGQFRITGFLQATFGSAAYLFPWVWGLLVWVLGKQLLRFGSVRGADRLLVCLAIVPIGFFGAVSCYQRVLPHWPLFGFALLYPLAGAAWAQWAAGNPEWSRRRIGAMVATAFALTLLVIAQARFGVIRFPSNDPLTDVSGWESVGAELTSRGLIAEPHTFLFTTSWHQSGQLAFVLREQVPVLCYNGVDARGFAFWSQPDDWVGWNGLLVATTDCQQDLEVFAKFFRRIEPVAVFPMTRSGTPFRTVWVYRCIEQIHPFPFTYKKLISPGSKNPRS